MDIAQRHNRKRIDAAAGIGLSSDSKLWPACIVNKKERGIAASFFLISLLIFVSLQPLGVKVRMFPPLGEKMDQPQ
jgi:hypothetical protein